MAVMSDHYVGGWKPGDRAHELCPRCNGRGNWVKLTIWPPNAWRFERHHRCDDCGGVGVRTYWAPQGL